MTGSSRVDIMGWADWHRHGAGFPLSVSERIDLASVNCAVMLNKECSADPNYVRPCYFSFLLSFCNFVCIIFLNFKDYASHPEFIMNQKTKRKRKFGVNDINFCLVRGASVCVSPNTPVAVFVEVSKKDRPARHRGSMCPSKSSWYQARGLRPAQEMEGTGLTHAQARESDCHSQRSALPPWISQQ